ncbi:MAG: alpha/beta hydrolase [Paracoccaceae bacterium]
MSTSETSSSPRPEALYPPTGQILDLAGSRVHAHQEGSGPDLVLIHGASGNTREFTFSLAGKLAADFRVTVFDRPGHGHSSRIAGRENAGETPIEQARLLKTAADRLGLVKPVILGQSYGGAVALAYALAHPQDLSALVCVAGVSNPWPGVLDPWYRLTDTFLGRRLAIPLVAAALPHSYVRNSVAAIFAPDPVPPGYLEHIGLPLSLRRVTLEANTQQINRLLGDVAQMAPRYGSIDVPTEIVHGTNDITVPLDIHALPLSRQIPGAQLTRLDGIGHMPHHAAERDVIAAVHRAANRAGLR